MIYRDFSYKYPPRPEIILPKESLPKFDKDFLWDPKLNGSCAMSYTCGTQSIFMNRHKSSLITKISDKEYLSLNNTNKWMCTVGEYMNKSKADKNGKTFNHKFVIFDILVYDGIYLLDSSIEYRKNLITEVFSPTSYDKYLSQISDNIFVVNHFSENALELFNEISQIDMYEGLVGKKRNSKLENGVRPANNVGWQIKTRKPTKNYSR